MQKSAAESLLQKFLDGTCSDEELALLESWYNQYVPGNTKKLSDVQWAEDVHSILYHLGHSTRRRRSHRLVRIAAAACILLGLGVTGYWLIRQKHAGPEVTHAATPDILPGGNKATLTLANGQKLVLEGTQNGRLAQQNDIVVTKTKDGQLLYTAENKNMAASGNSAATAGIGYNTISTPSGGQYQVTLSDGSRVWLNAASSLSYPVSFSGVRTVNITGEAYFEVAPDEKKPFLVKSHGEQVEVLGTSFNINSYEDEPVTRTTLLDGKIRINGSTILRPGQQAQLSGPGMHVVAVDTEPVVAWKNDKFMFDNADIQTIMRMIARWYDVKVEYTGPVTDEKFGGSVSRFSNVSSVLDILQLTGNVHFKVDKRLITVTK